MGQGQFRGIIVVVTFLSVILIIVSAAYVQTPTFFSEAVGGNSPSVAETNPSALLAWNKTDAFTLNSADPSVDYEVPNWRMTTWVEQTYGGQLAIHAYTYDTWWVFVTSQESLKWYNETTGAQLSTSFAGTIDVMPISTIEDAYDSDFNLNYRLTNTRGTLHVTLGWNTTAYGGNLTACFYGDGIHFSLSQDFSDRQTTLNLMDVMTGLFFGSIFGANTLHIDPIISAIITIGLDSALIYLVYSLVHSIIPLLPPTE